MIAAPALRSGPGSDGPLDGYLDYVVGLDCVQQAKSIRKRAAQRFLASFADLDKWMLRPTAARLEDARRADAWPFLCWCFAVGRLRADVDLIAAQTQGAHYSTWWRLNPAEVERAVGVGRQLGWGDAWIDQVCVTGLAFVCLTTGSKLDDLDDAVFAWVLSELDATLSTTPHRRRVLGGRIRALQLVCYQLGTVAQPATHPNTRDRSLAEQLAKIAQPDIARLIERYLQVCSTTLRPATIEDRCDSFKLFAMWLHERHTDVERVDQLNRHVIEGFLSWNHTRPSRGRRSNGQPVSITRQHATVSALKAFFEDITLWGWAERPPRPLLHRSDLPRIPTTVPRALSPDADRDLMAAVDELDDVAARCAIKVLRGTGLRAGELLDLELDCLADYHDHGTWLRVPVGKLNTERTVPVDEPTLAAFDEWAQHRGACRPIQHPRTHRPVDFMWIINGKRMGTGRLRNNLKLAAANAGIGHVHPHQLRHTYATKLINGGMSLEALMTVLGHVSPQMTLRYAHLASDSIRVAYDNAMNKARPARFVAGPTGQFVPDHIEWLHGEMIKTRVAHGYCSRHPAAGACAYANICEQCDNYIPDPSRKDVLDAQLADVIALRDDAQQRGWTGERVRHEHVADALARHLRIIEIQHTNHPRH
ncbi:MAG: tyrosine-type recombinase/integrase [Acidimicrobiia bacterium]